MLRPVNRSRMAVSLFCLTAICLLIFSGQPAAAQKVTEKEVSGIVTGTDGSPEPGVAVMVKGTQNGTMTDENGKFSLKVRVISGQVLLPWKRTAGTQVQQGLLQNRDEG